MEVRKGGIMEQLSFFNVENKLKQKSIILSASRMTDMPKFYPNELINEVESRINKGKKIHTLVLWSKHPDSLLKDPLYSYLNKLKKSGIQLYYQCTITGMGGKSLDKEGFMLEPNVPKPENAIQDLERVIKLLGKPELIKLRIDPIVRLKNKQNDKKFSNIVFIEEIISRTSKLGINDYTFSFLESYIHKKVDKRFKAYDWQIETPTNEEKIKVYNWLKEKALKYNVNIEACCVMGLKESRCIDGYLFESIKNNQEIVDKNEPRKRVLCACTSSIDIGGWSPKKCYSKCKYCYANADL